MAFQRPLRIVVIGPSYPYRGGIAHFIEKMARGLPITWIQTARAIRRSEPDILLLKYWMPFFAPAFGSIVRWASSGRTRVVVVVDNALPHEPHIGDRALSRYFLKAAHRLVVMSKDVRRDLETLGVTGSVTMVPHPVYDIFGDPVDCSIARERLGIGTERPVLLFFGFVRRYKGLHVLLEAMPEIISRLPTALLIVAGEFYEDEQPYRDAVERLGIGDHVLIRSGYVSDSEIPLLFSAADVVVQPYITATQSGVAQIAYHFATPVITTDVGGLAETVRDGKTGFVVPPESPAELAEAVVRFETDGHGPGMSRSIVDERSRFGWDEIYTAVEEAACE
jgi:glycosyltransferase involved in cell wall biosynthesis